MVADLGATKESPKFEVDGEDVMVMFDPPHILKSIRNNLFSKNLVFDGKLVSFKHIRSLYNLDVENVPRLAPKFKRKSLLENPFDKMNVAAVTSVFSNTSSIAMTTYIETRHLPPEAAPTAEFMKEMDSFFDCYNSSDKMNMCKVNILFFFKYSIKFTNITFLSR